MKLFVRTLGLLFCLLPFTSMGQLYVVNKKGTITSVDSSKWTSSGTHIFNKNTGNVGLGNPSPTYKLDITGKLRLTDSLIAEKKSKFSDTIFAQSSVNTLHFVSAGAVFGNVSRLTSTGTYTVSSTDYILHLSSGFTASITLPAVATSNGRVLYISNHSGAARTTSIVYRTGSGTTTNSIGSNAEINIACDGVEWFTLGQ